jgi:hypothetical protein
MQRHLVRENGMKNDTFEKRGGAVAKQPAAQAGALISRLLTPEEVTVVSGGVGYAMRTIGYCQYSQGGDPYSQQCAIRY